MKFKFYGLFLLLTLISSSFFGLFPLGIAAQNIPDVLVGVDIAYGDVEDVKSLADKVETYANLIILGCTAVTQNKLKLEEACQYLFDKGFFFIVYQEYPLDHSWLSFSKSTWYENAKTRWSNQFLGIYYTDEVGGKQLDQYEGWISVPNADNYASASDLFNQSISKSIDWFKDGYTNGNQIPIFTSDYALYWFDYQAGYDVVLAQFGWNYSRELNVGLCRGAATALDKDWGAILTWTYKQPPYIESGREVYNDLLLAYNNGAKYIAVFDSDKDYTASILEQEHLDALKEFWQYTQQNTRRTSLVSQRTAYALPQDYAYGFRGPEDKIWGLWQADALSGPISSELGALLGEHDSNLDIIYEDELGLGETKDYKILVYWNTTSFFSDYPPVPISSPSAIWSLSLKSAIVFLAVGVFSALTLGVSYAFLRKRKTKSV